MDQEQDQIQDPYQGISQVVEQLIKNLNQAQQNSAKEALSDNPENDPIYLKGKSLVNLVCHDFCLSKYPFKNYNFDYEFYMSIYLESERYDWLMEKIFRYIKSEWEIDLEDYDSIQLLYILSGAYTADTNNTNRQKKITDLKQILYFIFELNFVATYFTRPTFDSSLPYKSALNEVCQKFEKMNQFNIDIETDDMKNPMHPEEGFPQKPKPKQPLFKSTLNLFGCVTLISFGEQSKNTNCHLLSKEILHILQCFKDFGSVLDFIQQKLNNESSQIQNPKQREIQFIIKYLEYYAKKNFIFVDQNLDQMLLDSQQQLNVNKNVQSSIFSAQKISQVSIQNSMNSAKSDQSQLF